MVRLLLVDDEPDIIDTITQLLEATLPAVEVVTAPNGLEALDRLRQGGIDVVVTDYRMPGLNGAELVLKIRESWPRLPTIMMTAYFDANTVKEVEKLVPGLELVAKPIEIDPFLAQIRQLLAERGTG